MTASTWGNKQQIKEQFQPLVRIPQAPSYSLKQTLAHPCFRHENTYKEGVGLPVGVHSPARKNVKEAEAQCEQVTPMLAKYSCWSQLNPNKAG